MIDKLKKLVYSGVVLLLTKRLYKKLKRGK